MRRVGLAAALLAVMGLVGISGTAAFGADNGTVNATVSVQDVPCVTVGTPSIDYGTKAFSDGTLVTGSGTISNVDSCSTAAQTLSAKGSDATGSAGAAWTLVSSFGCGTGSTNEYRHTVRNSTGATVTLSLADQAIWNLTSNQQDVSIPTTLIMPCEGSSGAGQVMSMQVILTATIP